MCQHLNNNPPRISAQSKGRRGLTLIELLMVTTILVMMAGAMAALASVVQSGNVFNHDHSLATQHGRVALERIERAIASANASAEFPGCFVYVEQINGWAFPDTLVVWDPEASAAAPNGRPLISELVVFCPNPNIPSELLEIRLGNTTGLAPALDDIASWQTLISQFKTADGARRVPLTDLLRTASPNDADTYPRRGALRFDVQLRPSAAEWQEFQMGSRIWEDLSWAQGIHGSGTGLRQTWCRIEIQMQLKSYAGAGSIETASDTTIPFFGSGTIYHELRRS